MCHTAIVHMICYLGQVQFVIDQQFFDPFNFMSDIEFFNSGALYFRKKIGKIGVVMVQLLA